MALLPDWLSGETWDIVRNKFNDLISGFNGTGGGTTGQVLKKQSNTDFDYDWEDDNQVSLAGGTTGQLLSKASDDDNDFEWVDPIEFETEGWTAITIQAGYSGTLEWGIDKVGRISLRGTVTKNSGSSALIGTLPVSARPSSDRYCLSYNSNGSGSTALCIINTDGTIELKNMDQTVMGNGNVIHLESVPSFPTF